MRRLLAVLLALCVLAAGCSGGSQSGGVGITGDDPRPAAVVDVAGVDALVGGVASGCVERVGAAPGLVLGTVGVAPVDESDADRIMVDHFGIPWAPLSVSPVWFDYDVGVVEGGSVTVVPESVTVRDGVVRGLVQNQSAASTAGYVTVFALDREVAEGWGLNDDPDRIVWHRFSVPYYSTSRRSQPRDVVWEWPLAIPPGGVAPFEITGWSCEGGADEIFFRVTGAMIEDYTELRSGEDVVEVEHLPSSEHVSRGYGLALAYDFYFATCPSGGIHSGTDKCAEGTDILLYDERMYEHPQWDLLVEQNRGRMAYKGIFVDYFYRDYLIEDTDFSFPAIYYSTVDVRVDLGYAYPELQAACGQHEALADPYISELAVYQGVVDASGRVIDVRKVRPFAHFGLHLLAGGDYFVLRDPVRLSSLCEDGSLSQPWWSGRVIDLQAHGGPLDARGGSIPYDSGNRTRWWAGEAYFPTDPYRTPDYGYFVQGTPLPANSHFETWTEVELEAEGASVAADYSGSPNAGEPANGNECISSGGPLETTPPKQEHGTPGWSERSTRDDDQTLGRRLTGYMGVLDANRIDGGEGDLLVEVDSLRIRDGVVRGLIFNPSDTRFARNATIAMTTEGSSSSSPAWEWPLTIQPGERAPFELPLPDGRASAESLQFDISADYSSCIDLSRSFKTWFNFRGSASLPSEREPTSSDNGFSPRWGDSSWRDLATYDGDLPISLYSADYQGFRHPDSIIEGVTYGELGRLAYYEIYASLQPPDSHPNLDEAIANLDIDDLQIHLAILDAEGKVKEIKRLPPFTATDYRPDGSRELAPSNSIPNTNPEYPNSVHALVTLPGTVGFIDETFQIWIGGANG